MSTRQPPRPVDPELYSIASSLQLIARRFVAFQTERENLRRWMADPTATPPDPVFDLVLLWDGLWARVRWVAEFFVAPPSGDLVVARHYRSGFTVRRPLRDRIEDYRDQATKLAAHQLRDQTIDRALPPTLAADLIAGARQSVAGLDQLDDTDELKPLYRLMNGAANRAQSTLDEAATGD